MDRKEDLYPGYEGQLKTAKKRIAGLKACEANKRAFLDFLTKLEADGTSKAQQISYVNRIVPIMELLGDTAFKDVTKSQMEQVFAMWRGRKKYKQASINKSVQCLKAFYRWLFDLTSQDPAPEVVRWLKREKSFNGIRVEDLWTEEDMEKVMKNARSLRDKCILAVLFEAGLRPGELRGLRMKDVAINKDMVRLYVAGKTKRIEGERVLPLLRSYNLIRMWVSQHPERSNPDAWLWTTGKEPIKDATFSFMIKEVAKKAGMTKPSNPYILRHTALTKFYKKLPGPIASKLAGHAPGSKEAQTYCHLALEDLDNSIREMNGAPKKELKEEIIRCHKCNQTLAVGDRLCPICGLAQDNEIAAKHMDDVEEALNVKAGLETLGKKYPELGELISKLLDKEKIVNLS